MIARQRYPLLPASARPRRSAVRVRLRSSRRAGVARTRGGAPRVFPAAVWQILLDDRCALPAKWGMLALLLLAAAMVDSLL